MNTDSGNRPKVFTLRQNGCSHKTRTGVHFKSESVFTLGQNTQRGTPSTYACRLQDLVMRFHALRPVLENDWIDKYPPNYVVT